MRSLVLVFWLLVFWGTLYGAVLLAAAVTEGPGAALQRALGGTDALAGWANVTLAGLAAIFWGVVGFVITRRLRESGEDEDARDP